MLGLGLTLSLGGNAGGGVPAVQGDTTQSGYLTFAAGTTPYRDGVDITSSLDGSRRYTKTSADALSVFWQTSGTRRSDPLTVASTAGVVPAVTHIDLKVINRNDNTTGTCLPTEIRVKGGDGVVITGTWSAPDGYGNGPPTILNDGLLVDPNVQIGSGKRLRFQFFTATNKIFGGTIELATSQGNGTFGIGDFEIWYSTDNATSFTLLSSFDNGGGWTYGYNSFTSPKTLATYGALSITSLTYSASADTLAHVVAGTVTQLKQRLRDFTDASYPVLISDWANVSGSATVNVTAGGIYRSDFTDTFNAGAAVQSGEQVVCSKPTKRIGMNMGTYRLFSYWNPKISLHTDLMDRASWTTSLSGAAGGLRLGGPNPSPELDKYNRLIAWPTGSTYVRILIAWSFHSADAGDWEWLNGGVYTRANYGTAWTLVNGGGAPVSVSLVADGPNGGVKFTIGSDTVKSWWIELLSLPSPMTANTLRKIGETDATWTVSQAWVDSKAPYVAANYGDSRWMWGGLEGFQNWDTLPHVSEPDATTSANNGFTYDQYVNNFPTWANRLRAGRCRPEIWIETANRTLCPPMICIPFSANDDYLNGLAGLVASTLSSSVSYFAFAVSNEVWNFNDEVAFAFVYEGYKLGYQGDTPNRTPVNIVRNNGNTATVTGTYPAGTILVSFLSGTLWTDAYFYAKQDTTGLSLPTGGVGFENADWICVARADLASKATGYDQYGNAKAAGYRFYGVTATRMARIFKQHIPVARLRAVVEGFTLWGVSYNTATDSLTQALHFSATAGGEALVDVMADGIGGTYVDYADAPYIPNVSVNCVTVDATPGATRQAAMATKWHDTYAANGDLATSASNRVGFATILSQSRTINGIARRYSMNRSIIRRYEAGHNMIPTNPTASFTASISGTTVTISASSTAPQKGQYLSGHGGTTCKFTDVSGLSGGVGTATIDVDQGTITSRAMTAGNDSQLIPDLNQTKRNAAIEADVTQFLTDMMVHGGTACLFDEGAIEGSTTTSKDWNWFDQIPDDFVTPTRGMPKALVDYCNAL